MNVSFIAVYIYMTLFFLKKGIKFCLERLLRLLKKLLVMNSGMRKHLAGFLEKNLRNIYGVLNTNLTILPSADGYLTYFPNLT